MKKDKEVYDKVCEYLSPHLNKDMEVLELACWFRVIIVIEANSYVNIRSSRLLPKFKTQKINSWCAAYNIHFNNGYCKQHTNEFKDSLKSLIL
ncbi:TPA: hypothetical protein VV392_001062 [Streptococcus pneumoniae]|uniref:hypothetical protein n=1 Tax=Streptococcus pneumoniae TaxID=1313 RepID=UPI00067CFA49|nr:hypothetical protein [Streptococcus pneumoniae]MBW5054228.1 hypothetical protein [Streptococcus pneumoniae]MDD0777336.1 hypothetical protein [Streptococcus pneumoniae]MDD0786730.1 hypothetical protein [Streptococcus pneumoniae]MDG7121017.1 hypothetical protein [Streptococcus pneumoniae]MDG7122871.1 hypothetical protein [Streptococcus pneumoniae]